MSRELYTILAQSFESLRVAMRPPLSVSAALTLGHQPRYEHRPACTMPFRSRISTSIR